MKMITYFKVRYCLLLAGFIFLSTALQAEYIAYGVKEIDSLELRLQAPSLSDDEICDIYLALGDAYTGIDNEKTFEYLYKGIRLAEKNKNYYYSALFYHNAGDFHKFLSQLDSSVYYLERSLALHAQAVEKGAANKEQLDLLQMNLSIGFAEINYYHGKYDLAVTDFLKALDLAVKMNKSEKIAEIYYGIGETYMAMFNFQQAEAYFLKAEQVYRTMNDPIGIANMYLRLSGVYIHKADHPKALEYAEESYRILSTSPDAPLDLLQQSVRRLSESWLYIPDYDKALEYSLKSVELADKTNRPLLMAQSLYQLAYCYLKKKQYKEVEETAFRAMAIDSSDLTFNSRLYEMIAAANVWLGNSEKGISYYMKAINLTRDFATENFQSSLSEMEVKYETEKKEMQIVALEKEKRLMTGLSLTVGCLLLFGLVALFFLWRWTIQKRRLAESQIKQLEQEKQLVATQAIFDGEVQERTRLARDLHDGLGGKLTCMKIGLQELKQIAGPDDSKEEQLKMVMAALDDSVQELRRVSHNLMPDTLNRSGLKAAIDEFCRSMSSQIAFNYYGDETRLDIKLEVQIYRSIYELVNNALKYAGASQIMVQIVQETDTISFTVQDNGCGFDTTAQTEGMGLKNIRTRVASFGGDIQIDSKVGEGTEVNVELRIEN